jgi:hypothetical protein
MKKLFLMFAVSSFLVACGSSSDSTSTSDSTQVKVDSTTCDSTHCDTTKACCTDSLKLDSAAH